MSRKWIAALLGLLALPLGAQQKLKDEMAALEKEYGIHFVYDAHIRTDVRAGAPLQAGSLDARLDALLEGTDLRFEKNGKYVILKQKRRFSISGYITDAATGETLIGAGIVDEGGAGRARDREGTVTNSYGFYSLTLPEGEHRLRFSFIGYAAKEVRLNLDGSRTLNLTLKPDAVIRAATVTGEKETGVRSAGLGALEMPQSVLRRAPVLFGESDVLKALQLLPGVQAGNGLSSGVYVRGGGPDENLILLDGIPLYNVDHMGGIFSVFSPEAVKKVTLYKSSFPARYAGRTSSVVDVRTNDGNTEGLHGSVTAGLLAEKIHLDGPIGENTTFSVSGRMLHTGLLDPLIRGAFHSPVNYWFYDTNAKLVHRFGDRDRLYAGFYHGRDTFLNDQESKSFTHYYDKNYAAYDRYGDDRKHFGLHWGNTVAALRWNHVFGGRLFSNTSASLTRYRVRMASESEERVDDSGYRTSVYSSSEFLSGITDLALRTDFEYTPSAAHAIRFGASLTRHVFVPDGQTLSRRETEQERTLRDTVLFHYDGTYMPGYEGSAYLEDEISAGDRLTFHPGVHFSLFGTGGKAYPSLQPRLAARWAMTDAVTLKAGYARMAQYVHLLPSGRTSLPTDVWVPITRNIPPQTADQYSAGVYYTGLPLWSISLEGYYKDLRNILELRNSRLAFAGADHWEETVATGIGRSYGVELLVERTAGQMTGWFSYTLSKSERRIPDGSVNHGEWFPYINDRRHKISLYADYSFNPRVDISATWQFATGNRMTLPTRHSIVLSEESGTEGKPYPEEFLYAPSRNNYVLPPTHRLDVSVNFRKKKTRGERIWNVGIYNVYAARNPDMAIAMANWRESADRVHIPGYPAGRIYVEITSFLTVIPSFSYTRTF